MKRYDVNTGSEQASPRPKSLGPYSFLGPRPFREARVRAYLVRQHRLGRRLDEILDDRYIAGCGGRDFAWRVVCQPETIAQLEADVIQELQALLEERARIRRAP